MLDPNDPGHARASEQLARDLVAWLTTVSPEGQPQSSPVWFLWDGDSLLLYSQPGMPKLRNIEGNPRVALNLRGGPTGDEVVTIEGRAELDAGAPSADRLPEYVEKFGERIRAEGWTPETFGADYSKAVRIRPTRFRAW
jgi:PPOX class probable F420-dependent enzyme